MTIRDMSQFMSDDLRTLIKFYDSFSDRAELMKWVRSIPKSNPIVEIAGDIESEIAVVVPTPSLNHPLAINCRNDIFNGLKLVFSIDSSMLFNLSHSYNQGARSLSRDQNIRWVIFSNVDMIRIDPPYVLMKELGNIGDDMAFAYPKSHPSRWRIGEITHLRKIVFRLLGNTRRARANIEKKFSIHLGAEDELHFFTRNFVSKTKTILNFADFFIFSFELLKNYNFEPFDEMYLNGMEDIDLSFRLFEELDEKNFKEIKYRIGSMESGIRGRSLTRTFRNIPGLAYFNERFENDI